MYAQLPPLSISNGRRSITGMDFENQINAPIRWTIARSRSSRLASSMNGQPLPDVWGPPLRL